MVTHVGLFFHHLGNGVSVRIFVDADGVSVWMVLLHGIDRGTRIVYRRRAVYGLHLIPVFIICQLQPGSVLFASSTGKGLRLYRIRALRRRATAGMPCGCIRFNAESGVFRGEIRL